ncbi:MAG TPA: hypothetical protein VE173_00735, partial [Longimicrobiales bacterium]|nr:hypothetical protein [Longimicrobiales bacterium]
MKGEDETTGTSRRRFLRGLTAVPMLGLLRDSAPFAPAARPSHGAGAGRTAPVPPQDRKLVGIQIGGRSFVDEGVERCLDTLQETGGV